MLKFFVIALVISVICRWALGKWPWDYLRPAPTRQQAIFKARKLLAVRESASHAEIVEAHKRLISMVHPDRGGSNDAVHEANAARDLLLDEIPDQN